MRRPWFLLAIAVVLLIAAGCDFPHIPPPGDGTVRYRDDIFSTVDKTADITYGSADNLSHQTITLKLDVYQPHGDTVTARPAIIWVHGGSFSGGDKTSPELVDESNVFAKKGYFNASINYRLEPGGCSAGGGATPTCLGAIQEATQDAQAAVRFLRTNASTYGIDPTRIAIGGSSAGAITALEVGYSTAENPASGVRAAVSLSGANLLTTANTGDAPALLFHGTADPLVPYSWAVGTRDRAEAAGVPAYLTTYQGAGHVPYAQNRADILEQTRNFLWWEMAAGAAT